MPAFVSALSDQSKLRNDFLFDKIRRQSANFVHEDKPLPPPNVNNVPYWTANVSTSRSFTYNLDDRRTVNDQKTSPKGKFDTNKMAPAVVKEQFDGQTPTKTTKAVCPVHKENDVILFEDPTCSSPGCVYSPNQKHVVKRSRQSHREYQNNANKTRVPNERLKRSYGPLKLYNSEPRLENDKPPPRNSEKSTIPTKSFYSTNKSDLPAMKFVKKRIIDSSPPELVTIDELNYSSENRSSPPRAVTRSQTVSSSPNLFLPYEIGLENLGNTCYVNATLQVLLSLPGFSEDLDAACKTIKEVPECVDLFNKIAVARKKGMSSEVNKLNNDYVYNLRSIHPSYESQDQQDANEFLVRLIEQMRQALPTGPSNPVEAHFQCELAEVYHCQKCGAKSKRATNHTSICLPILENSHNLEQCLEDYTVEEERPIECLKCKAASLMVSSKFLTLPKKLIMSVNRYSKEEKVMKPIVPPEELDIGRFVEDSISCKAGSKYRLAAQIVHVGNSKSSGHYICHIFCEDGSWRLYNDTEVRPVSLEGEIQTVEGEPAYIYFYVKASEGVF